MSIWLDPTGQPTYGIGICARCSKKMFIAELSPDPNSPGLLVCKDDRDEFDPWRLPARRVERMGLPFARPDVNIDTNASGWITDDGTGFIITDDGLGYLVP